MQKTIVTTTIKKEKRGKNKLSNLLLFPVGPLTSNGRLLNVHIGPLDVQKGRSMDV